MHEDYHQATDSPEKIDSEKESRILKLLYYLGQEIGNAPGRPAWDPESRRLIVEEPMVAVGRTRMTSVCSALASSAARPR